MPPLARPFFTSSRLEGSRSSGASCTLCPAWYVLHMPTGKRVTVYLVRHGETFWNRESRCQGVTDIALSDKGYQQAHALTKVFSEKPLSLVLTSPLQRSRETAAIIAKPHNLSIEIHDGLREWNQGILEGLTGTALLRDHQEYFQRWFQDPARTAPPGGESLQMLQSRAWPVIDCLRERTLDNPIVVVSHTMSIATILCAALSLDLAQVHRFRIDLASKSVLTFTPLGLFSSWVLTSLNDRHHLIGDLL